jgi:large subunit ribosomal protein L14
MLQVQSLFRVCDNSGAKKVRCIKVLGGFKRKYAKVGDLIVVSVRRVKQHKKKKIKIKEGDVVRAVIVRSKAITKRCNYSQFKWKENAVVVIASRTKPFATRVIGPVSREIRLTKFMKLASLSSGLV